MTFHQAPVDGKLRSKGTEPRVCVGLIGTGCTKAELGLPIHAVFGSSLLLLSGTKVAALLLLPGGVSSSVEIDNLDALAPGPG